MFIHDLWIIKVSDTVLLLISVAFRSQMHFVEEYRCVIFGDFYFVVSKGHKVLQSTCLYVSISVSERMSETIYINFKFLLHLCSACRSVLWQYCRMLCDYSFVGDIMFAHYPPRKGDVNRE